MKKPLLIVSAAILGLAPFAAAGVQLKLRNQPFPAAAVTPIAEIRLGSDGHPLAEVVANPQVKIDITSDSVLRSCCRPPDLIVSGKVTNIASRPIKYVRLVITMRDADGRAVYSEDTYNHGAITLFEDPQIAKLLNEKPHFDPIAPGAKDSFVFAIPLPLIPSYKSAAISANATRGATTAKSNQDAKSNRDAKVPSAGLARHASGLMRFAAAR